MPTPSSAHSENARLKRLFGRRKGWKLRPRQAGLIETLLPRLALTPVPGTDPKAYFEPRPQEVWLEIGFGGGEHLAWQAEANPNVGLIGAEPFVAGIAKLLSRLDERAVRNVRLYTEDARDVLEVLPKASLARVFILFPDPWPKTRHHKRRFIQMETLDLLARVLKPGAELRFATDDMSYLSWALERLTAHAAFRWAANAAEDWRVRPDDWPQTRYESKALEQGRSSAYLRFIRA